MYLRKLLPFGVSLRENAQCPRCGSLERHRLLWLYLKKKTNFFKDSLQVLDVAPMGFFQKKFSSLPKINYFSVDISSRSSMMKMDITRMAFKENKFDCIICYHVLEHIRDDKKAMGELFRVLKPGGWGILQVPILRDFTFEDPSVPKEDREKMFGQKDHLRIYGRDYKNRLENIGFIVKVDPFVRGLGGPLIRRYCITKDEDIYYCTKPH